MEKCANCQAPVVFGPGTASLVCEHCGTKRPITPARTPAKSPIESADAAQPPILEGEARVGKCAHCGAETEFSGKTASTRCAFCDTAMEPKLVQGHRAPARAVVPFELPKPAAKEAFRKWLGSLWFRPNDLKRLAKLEVMDGAYVPSWRYDTHAWSEWTAEAGYRKTRTRQVERNGRTETETEHYTEWRHAEGNRNDDWADVVATGSRTVTTEEFASVEPFDFSKIAGFDRAWLAGFEAESMGRTAREAWTDAKRRVEEGQERRCASDVPGDTHRNLRVRTELSTPSTVDALLPLYVAAFSYREKTFRVLVNGQTAKVAGQAPWSIPKIVAAVVAGVAVVLALVWWTNQPR